MRSILFKLLGLFVVIASLGFGWVWIEYNSFMQTPLQIADGGLKYEVKNGMTLTSIGWDLKRRGIIKKPRYLGWMARWQGVANSVKTGEYEFFAGDTPMDFLEKIVAGKVVQYALTIVEGWTFNQLMEEIDSNRALLHELTSLSNNKIMERLGHKGEHPEGRFYPDTYLFPKGTSDIEFLQRAYLAMSEKLDYEWRYRMRDLPLKTSYDALILASIVERETAVPDERMTIAGVFTRRLKIGMRLQTDPTVIYGMGASFHGNIRRVDLAKDTPYNTYRRKGLTPTPIAMPGGDAIHAVLHPKEGNALYFVARGDGSHKFSATLQQHNRAVIKYQLKGRARSFSSYRKNRSSK